MKMKKLLALVLGVSMMASMVVGCGSSADTADKAKTEESADTADKKDEAGASADSKVISDETATLSVAACTANIDEYEKMGLTDLMAQYYPNVTLQFEEYGDSEELLTALKVRASANEMPDIVVMKASQLTIFEDYFIDLTGAESAAKNTVADAYAINGKLLGLPTEKSESTTIVYWKEMFEQAGVTEVPTTWPEFLEVCDKVEAEFGANDKNFITYCMGALDAWATYPFTEFMIATINEGNGNLWNDMATVDEPFTPDSELYEGYHMVYDFFTRDYFGADPLGVGYDQTSSLLYAKQACMIQCTSVTTFLGKAEAAGADTSTIGAFYLPTRDTEDDVFNMITQGDSFLSISTSCKNPELATSVVDTFFNEDIYPQYLSAAGSVSSIEGIEHVYDIEPMKEAIAAVADIEKKPVVLLTGEADYKALEAEVEWNFKKLGTQFFIDGFDFDGEMNRLNGAWKAAREKLNIQ